VKEREVTTEAKAGRGGRTGRRKVAAFAWTRFTISNIRIIPRQRGICPSGLYQTPSCHKYMRAASRQLTNAVKRARHPCTAALCQRISYSGYKRPAKRRALDRSPLSAF
jgi:hypothetical protein